MTLGPTLLWLNAGFFLLYGVAFAVFPAGLARAITDGAPSVPSALIDMRATYGGMTAAVGVLLGLCAASPSTVGLGLRGVAAVMLAMASGRTLGIALDGSPNGFMYLYLAAELAVFTLAVVALRASRTEGQ